MEFLKLPYLHWEMYGRKARMATTVQKIIEAGKQPSNTGGSVKHVKSDDLMNLKEQNRRRFGVVTSKPEPTENVDDAVWKTVDQWRFKRHVTFSHSRLIRTRQ